jgi:hypothetical protein
MAERDILRRLDQHLERGNVLMEQNRLAHEDLRTFIREITRRNEVVWREVLGELRDMRAESREHRAESQAEGRAQRDILYDIVDENRAQREGLMRMIHELRRRGPGDEGAAA